MSEERRLSAVRNPGSDNDLSRSDGPSAPEAGNPLRLALLALRGRWIWAVSLAILLGGPAGVAGWRAGSPKYLGHAELHIDANTEDYGLLAGENRPAENYDSFADMQVEFLRSPRVVDKALDSDEWRALGRAISQDAVNGFIGRLQVTRKGEIVTVELPDSDATAATVGVQMVLKAYQDLYTDRETQRVKASIDFLMAELGRTQNKLEALNNQIADKMQEQGYANFGPDDLGPVVLQKMADISALELRLVEVQEQRELADADLQQKQADPISPEVDWKKRELDAAKKAAEMAKLTEQRLLSIRTDEYKKLDDVTKLKHDIHDLQDQSDKERQKRDEIQRSMDMRNALTRAPGRISVLLPPEKPTHPASDSRPIYAAAGGAGGVVLGFASVLLIGLLNRRIRGFRDLGSAWEPKDLLGLLPQMPEGLEDPAQAAAANHCVNHIRTRLQLWYGDLPQLVLAITGASAGVGKTSLTLTLGMSFAAARSRTLLIDFDLQGGDLSARVGATRRPKLGRLLLKTGQLKRAQLNEALRTASSLGLRLGETLVTLGYLREADVAAALDAQAQQSVGVLDALDDETLADYVVDGGIPNLHILPLGNATMDDGGRVSPLAIQRLVDAARAEYDVVLIDTGPLPGSSEGSAAAAVADGVVLTVSQGEDRARLQVCLAHLRTIRASLAGVVFNRATAKDIARMHFSSERVLRPRANP